MDELLGLLLGDKTALPAIPARRASYLRYKALPPCPSVIRGRFDPFQWAAEQPQNEAAPVSYPHL